MIIRLAPLALLLMMTLACSKDRQVLEPEPSNEITASEFSVLGAIVDSVIIGPSSKEFIVSDSTSCGMFSNNVDSALTSILQRIGQRITALQAETMLDFTTKNLNRFLIPNPEDINPRW